MVRRPGEWHRLIESVSKDDRETVHGETGQVPAMIPATPMLDDIARQPEVLRSLGLRLGAFRAAGARLLGDGPVRRVVVTGCGDGLFAAEAVAGFAERLGLDWRATGAMEVLVAPDRLSPEDRVVAISMSGNVDRTVEAATLAESRGVPMLALVNGDGGRLGRIADAMVSLDLPDLAPFLCGTASYTATILALMAIADGLAGRETAALAAPDLPEAVAASIRAARAAMPGVAAAVTGGVRFLSAGPGIGTARYGAAKLVELTRAPAWPGELEEFAHSQFWAMPASDLVVCIATDPVLAGYARESCKALAAMGVLTLAIDTAACPVDTARHRVTVQAAEPVLTPLLAAPPLQLFGYHLARAQGLDPDRRPHLKNDEERFRVSRMLTRRSLLGTGL
jgi:fructoselysine-6-P-deglycase FrlB-like protein